MNPSSSPLQCPACFKWFATEHGHNIHLLQAHACKWYWKGKLRDLSDDNVSMGSTPDDENDCSDFEMGEELTADGVGDNLGSDNPDDSASDSSLEEHHYCFPDEFRLVPPSSTPPTATGGPGPSTQAHCSL